MKYYLKLMVKIFDSVNVIQPVVNFDHSMWLFQN
jgi:hypothetical protein